ncbi:MAG: DEAD/DEAH box helicase [Rickettsiales bacterium]
MENFDTLGLPELLIESLEQMRFSKPTPIQAQTIPSALKGLDILGSAQTGTGKTGAYGIPLVSFLMNNPTGTALVLTPTRELALQVQETLKKLLGSKSGINTTLLIGGEVIFKQLKQLKYNPRIIVGTPGRVNDHLVRGTLKLDKTSFFVLDEIDRMLDMGFSIQIQKILKYLPEKRQTLMFSATISAPIAKLAAGYLKDAITVAIEPEKTTVEKIKQEVLMVSEGEKYEILLQKLEQFPGSIIIFVKTKMGAEKLYKKLKALGHNADAIHGDLRQRQRDRVMKFFREGKNRILVATDVAARGLDVPMIECVINYDLPQCSEDFIHRIGRTGRAGASGQAVSLVSPADRLAWRNICRLINPNDKSLGAREEDRKPRRGGGRSFGGGGGGGRGFGGGSRGRSFGGGSGGGRDRDSAGGGGRKFGQGRPNRFKKSAA